MIVPTTRPAAVIKDTTSDAEMKRLFDAAPDQLEVIQGQTELGGQTCTGFSAHELRGGIDDTLLGDTLSGHINRDWKVNPCLAIALAVMVTMVIVEPGQFCDLRDDSKRRMLERLEAVVITGPGHDLSTCVGPKFALL